MGHSHLTFKLPNDVVLYLLLINLKASLALLLRNIPKFSVINRNPFPMEMDSVPNGNATSASPPQTTTPTNAPTTPFSKLTQLTEALKLEHQFLRVPFEHYKKTIRANHRAVEKEVSSVISGVADMADSDNFSKDDAVNHLRSLVSRLQGLKRKVSL